MPTAALCCLMLYLFETMANATIEQRISAPNQGTCPSRFVQAQWPRRFAANDAVRFASM